MHIDKNQSRRTFMRRSAQLGFAGAAAPLLNTFGLIGEAAAAITPTDYKALVCVFMYGGNDNANTLVPYDSASHAAYAKARPNIGLSRAQLGGTVLKPANGLGGRQFALNPALSPLMPHFNSGKLASVVNVGTLVQPTTKQQYLNKSVQLPPKLFSHNDQISYVQSFQPEGASAGWGGRMGDLLQAANGTAALTCVSLQGQSVWLSGQNAIPYSIGPGGITELLFGGTNLNGSQLGYRTMCDFMTNLNQTNWIAQEHAKVTERSLAISKSLSYYLTGIPQPDTSAFSGSFLASQLAMITRMIAIAPRLGIKRQVFFTGIGGFDTHSNLSANHAGLLADVGRSLSDFYNATAKMGVANKVTAFTASDFGRSLAENGDGSDHGWGSSQFVLGGAVKGGRIYGTPPTIGLNTNDDVSSGRWVPTTSIDQLATSLGMWFGLQSADLTMLMPNLRNFNTSSWNPGIL